jgi:hypothetical protein
MPPTSGRTGPFDVDTGAERLLGFFLKAHGLRAEGKVEMMRRTLGFITVVVLATTLAATAAGPGDSTPPGQTAAPAAVRSGFAGKSETTITGFVVDEGGTPLVDVNVKLYMGGLLTKEQLTSSDGTFEFTELIDYGRDVTVDLWFVPPGEELVMENVLLKESSTARQHGLYSPCTQRVRLDPLTDVVVKLYTLESRIAMLKRKDCLN